MTFRNSVVGGTTLVRPAIKSPNYTPGVDGWSINADGSAEFNNITIRGGTVISGTALYYDGPPGPGTLFLSISASPGTDPFGNAYPEGLTVGRPGESQLQLTTNTAGAGFVNMTTNLAGETRAATLVTEAVNEGTPTEQIITQIQGAQLATNGFMVVDVNSGIPGSVNPTFRIINNNGISSAVVAAVDQNQIAITPRAASANSVIFGGALTGHTGRLLRLVLNGADQFAVSSAGVLDTYGANTVNSWTPALTNAGSVTYTTQFGWWQRVGKLIIFGAYIVVNAAGSGAGLVGLTAPVAIERTGRQNVALNGDNITGFSGSLSAVALSGAEGGTGAVFERVRSSTGTNLTGAGVIAGSRFTLDGWYREA
jgi:hypothetical protein